MTLVSPFGLNHHGLCFFFFFTGEGSEQSRFHSSSLGGQFEVRCSFRRSDVERGACHHIGYPKVTEPLMTIVIYVVAYLLRYIHSDK